MKLVEMKCKNCGSILKVDSEAKETTCSYCQTTFKIDDEILHHKIDDAEQTGYEMEKGRLRAQKEAKEEAEKEKSKVVDYWLDFLFSHSFNYINLEK